MRIIHLIAVVTLAASSASAGGWFPGTKAVYNKWHETELERWLSDHSIPYPSPADRKDLEALVEKNWHDLVVEPYKGWDAAQLTAFLQSKGQVAKREAEQTKETLISKVKSNWYETEESTHQAWSDVKTWILDTWTDSQLKKFCDKHGVPVPQPRQRDTVLQKARMSYETIAKQAAEAAAYPGDWLYETWSESDLKEWLDKYGIPAPQPTSRDKLIASVRRNSRLAYLKAQHEAATASASAQAAYATLTDMIIDQWSESHLKQFCDKNGIPVPQGSRVNELRALVRKHRAQILGDTMASSASSAFGAATSNAENQYARASDSATLAAKHAFDQAVSTWSESRLKSYLDARGVPIPQGSNVEKLRALVRKNTHKISTGGQAWTFGDFSSEKLKQYLVKNGDAAAKAAAEKRDAARHELVSAAQSAYTSASKAGGTNFASATSYISSATSAAKQNTFNSWSQTDLKAYLDSYGIPVPQGSNVEELKALARRHSTYFKYGTSSPGETLGASVKESILGGWGWIMSQLSLGGQAAKDKVAEAESAAKDKMKEEL